MNTHRRAAQLQQGDGRTVTVRLVPWNETAIVANDRGAPYREVFRRDGLRPLAGRPLVATLRHGGPVVGRIVATESRADGLYGSIRLRDTSAARDLRELMATDDVEDDQALIDMVSVEFDDDPNPNELSGGLVERTAAVLTGVAFEPAGAYTGSRVLAVRSQPTNNPTIPTTEETEMNRRRGQLPTPDNESHGESGTAADAAATPAAAPAAVEAAPNPAPAPAQHERAAARPLARPGAAAGALAEMGRFESFGAYARAAYNGELDSATARSYNRALMPARHLRALADVVTGDMPSVVRDSWVTEILDLVTQLTPTINAFASRPLPASGMTVYQPTLATRPTVGEQVNQKDEITSTAIELDSINWPVKTFAGGNDVAIQVIERADIGTLDEFMRLYVQEMARAMNAAVAAGVVAAADDVNPAVELVGDDFNAAVISAAKPILVALGRLPNVALLSVDMWEFLGNIVDADGRPIYPTINPINPMGSFSVTDTSGNVRGLTYVVEPNMAGKRAVLGVDEAYVTRRSGVRTLTADVPSLLGKDIAVYEYVAHGATDKRGLSTIVDAV